MELVRKIQFASRLDYYRHFQLCQRCRPLHHRKLCKLHSRFAEGCQSFCNLRFREQRLAPLPMTFLHFVEARQTRERCKALACLSENPHGHSAELHARQWRFAHALSCMRVYLVCYRHLLWAYVAVLVSHTRSRHNSLACRHVELVGCNGFHMFQTRSRRWHACDDPIVLLGASVILKCA